MVSIIMLGVKLVVLRLLDFNVVAYHVAQSFTLQLFRLRLHPWLSSASVFCV